MCGLIQSIFGGGAPKMAPVVDAAAQQESADAKATQGANAKLAARNRRRGASLLATGAGDTGLAQSAPAAKTVLGA